jgi:hypothetical protein
MVHSIIFLNLEASRIFPIMVPLGVWICCPVSHVSFLALVSEILLWHGIARINDRTVDTVTDGQFHGRIGVCSEADRHFGFSRAKYGSNPRLTG